MGQGFYNQNTRRCECEGGVFDQTNKTCKCNGTGQDYNGVSCQCNIPGYTPDINGVCGCNPPYTLVSGRCISTDLPPNALERQQEDFSNFIGIAFAATGAVVLIKITFDYITDERARTRIREQAAQFARFFNPVRNFTRRLRAVRVSPLVSRRM